MKRLAFLFTLPLLLGAQDRGAKVFQQTCAVGYCHGSGGSANRAPRLANRGFEHAYVLRVVESGVPDSAMPAFKARLPEADLIAVVDYVMSLSGSGGPGPGNSAVSPVPPVIRDLPAQAKRGKDLFFDPLRDARCATCHAVDGLGIAVGPNLAAAAPDNGAALRNIKIRDVQMASTKDGDRFPALVVNRTGEWVKVYDLTVPPPVLRTLAAADVSVTPGNWSHATVISTYSAAELDTITAYLAWLRNNAR